MYEFKGAFLFKAPQVPWIYMKGIPVDTMKEAELSKVQPRPYTLQGKVEKLHKVLPWRGIWENWVLSLTDI